MKTEEELLRKLKHFDRELNEARATVRRVREFVEGFAERGGGIVNATDELWITSLRRVLAGETKSRACESCNGSGADWPEYPDDPCPDCDGYGEVEYIPVVVKRRKP